MAVEWNNINDMYADTLVVTLTRGFTQDSTKTLVQGLQIFRDQVNTIDAKTDYDTLAVVLDKRTTQTAIDEGAGHGNVYKVYSDAYVTKYSLANWWEIEVDKVAISKIGATVGTAIQAKIDDGTLGTSSAPTTREFSDITTPWGLGDELYDGGTSLSVKMRVTNEDVGFSFAVSTTNLDGLTWVALTQEYFDSISADPRITIKPYTTATGLMQHSNSMYDATLTVFKKPTDNTALPVEIGKLYGMSQIGTIGSITATVDGTGIVSAQLPVIPDVQASCRGSITVGSIDSVSSSDGITPIKSSRIPSASAAKSEEIVLRTISNFTGKTKNVLVGTVNVPAFVPAIDVFTADGIEADDTGDTPANVFPLSHNEVVANTEVEDETMVISIVGYEDGYNWNNSGTSTVVSYKESSVSIHSYKVMVNGVEDTSLEVYAKYAGSNDSVIIVLGKKDKSVFVLDTTADYHVSAYRSVVINGETSIVPAFYNFPTIMFDHASSNTIAPWLVDGFVNPLTFASPTGTVTDDTNHGVYSAMRGSELDAFAKAQDSNSTINLSGRNSVAYTTDDDVVAVLVSLDADTDSQGNAVDMTGLAPTAINMTQCSIGVDGAGYGRNIVLETFTVGIDNAGSWDVTHVGVLIKLDAHMLRTTPTYDMIPVFSFDANEDGNPVDIITNGSITVKSGTAITITANSGGN